MSVVKSYTPSASVTAAKQVLENIKNKKPSTWTGGSYKTQLESLAEQIQNREPFRYDYSKDTVYQNYKDQYQKLGKQAMKDTIGQAASLTGGYGNTYGQNVGQQAYDSYLQKLGDVVPELAKNARDAYDAEGDNLLQAYNMAGDQYDREYGEYADALSNWYKDVSAAQDSYEDTADRDYETWYDEEKLREAEEDAAAELAREDAATARKEAQAMVDAILKTGTSLATMKSTMPEIVELSGYTDQYMNSLASYYASQIAMEKALDQAKLDSYADSGSSSSGSSSSGSSSYKSSSSSGSSSSKSSSSSSSSTSSSSQSLSAAGSVAYSTLYNMKSKGATTAALKSKLNQLISSGSLTSYDQSYIRKKLGF